MPDSPPFPFLNLPILVQLLIVKCLDVSHFLMFSLISQRAKGIAKQVKFDIDSVYWDLNDEKKTYKLELRTRGGFVFLIFTAKQDAETQDSWFFKEATRKTLNVNKTPVPFYRFRSNRRESWRIKEKEQGKEDVLKLLEHLSKHILSVMKVKNFKFQSFNLKDPENFWGFQLIENWEQVDIAGCNSFFVEIKTLKFCLKTLNTRKLCLASPVEEGFKWTTDSGALKVEDLSIHDSKWITLDALLTMECKALRMSSSVNQLTENDLNKLIKHWLSGGLRNLNELVYNFELGIVEDRFSCILEGIETFQWEQRPRILFPDVRNIRDIKRSDGVVATAFVNKMKVFKFVVWSSVIRALPFI